MTHDTDQRVLLLMPTKRDGERMESVLAATGIGFAVCRDVCDLCRKIGEGAAAALLTEEAVTAEHAGCIQAALAEQPPWSDFPLVILAREHGKQEHLRESMNATLVERPVKVRSLLSVLRSALRLRRHQYELRDLLAKHQQAEDALREGDRRKDEFLATLAHELRNPLAPLRSSVHILQLTSTEDPRTKPIYDTMERQVNHLVRLVDDLLEMSRITRGKVELRKEPVELAAVVRNAIETSRPLIDAAGLRLTVSLPPERVVIVGDFVRLGQVLTNLLNNAAKYTNEGGQIWFTATCEGNEVVLSVRDTGIGIDTEMLPRVFDMFMQVDRATSRSQGGLGIGLTLVRSLVGLHGGSVAAYSEGRGRGSEFQVRLPIADGAQAAGFLRPTDQLTSTRPTRRVLVVDDNLDAATTLTTLLRHLGADVQMANDGPTALATVASHQPEVVFLDIGMPGMDGFEVAKRVRMRPECAEVVLIALTGWGQEDDRRRTAEAGFNHHLVKPVDVSALQAFLVP